MNSSLATTPVLVPKRDRSLPKTSPKKLSAKGSAPSNRKAPVTLSYAQFERLSVIAQVRRAFMPGARLAAMVGLVIGGFVPMASYTLVHFEVANNPLLWILVVGALLYSGITVFKWALAAFGNQVKAAGFVVLLEGILTFSHIHALSLSALGILIFINAVSSACALQVRKEIEADK